jgi:hypothetical protein
VQLIEGEAALAAPLPGQRVRLEGEELLGDEGADPGPDLLLIVAEGEVDHAHSFVSSCAVLCVLFVLCALRTPS